ncbi:protein argonaute-4-like isoform X2 [Limulus polyphemus]|uniref:Protein argonaute-4-like isoform X2 n=1 Tax=Limulus polyphemus TaxID=6850 RepID=A0ABM1T2S3_LIMPO|nr:protein argonaute-4-like isoform X2 [Limulus polyphemus]
MPPKRRGRGRGFRGAETHAERKPRQTEQVETAALSASGIEPAQTVEAVTSLISSTPTETTVLAEKHPLEETAVVKQEMLASEFQKMSIQRPVTSFAHEFPRRPGYGINGRKIALVANHFSIILPDGYVYLYDIEVSKEYVPSKRNGKKEPPTPSSEPKKYRCLNTKLNRRIFESMINTYRNSDLGNCLPAYDGRKYMVTKKRLNIPENGRTLVVLLEEERRQTRFEVAMKLAKVVNLNPIHAIYKGKVSSIDQEIILVLDIILRHGPALRLVPIGRSFFAKPDVRNIHPLSGGLEIWYGYHQSLRIGQWKPILNIDMTGTTFFKAQNLLDFICEKLKIVDIKSVKELKDLDIKRLNKDLNLLEIQVTHLSYPRKYRIKSLTRQAAKRLFFKLDDKSEITVAEYFKQNYEPLQYSNLPCVDVGIGTKNVYLPFEVCKIVEGQHNKRKLNERQTSDMVKTMTRGPEERFRAIQARVKQTSMLNEEYNKEFGIRVDMNPLKLHGRVLDAPTVQYKDEKKVPPRNGTWDLRNMQFFQGAQINEWALLSFSNPNFCKQTYLDTFIQMLSSQGQNLGMGLSNAPSVIKNVQLGDGTISGIFKNLKSIYPNVQLAVVVLSSTDSCYPEIKNVGDTQVGLITQCVLDTTVMKKCNPQSITNLLQKINAKMGGINSSIVKIDKPKIFSKPVIFIGADVTHPAPGDKPETSVAAAVGSLDSHPSKYAGSVRVQFAKDERKRVVEIIQNIKDMCKELLKAFYRNTKGKKPEKIIFYRDGVSEGQFSQVRDIELRQIREACTELGADYQPLITFITVQKRHHTRFAPQNFQKDGVGKCKNIPPGTTVDTDVTHPLEFDFFLCSHLGIQGTSRPAHYKVLWDDNNFSADELQKLTYYLCHTYVRCTRSISIPAPVMYAHLAAYRARLYITSRESHDDISSCSPEPNDVLQMNSSLIEDLKLIKDKMYFV